MRAGAVTALVQQQHSVVREDPHDLAPSTRHSRHMLLAATLHTSPTTPHTRQHTHPPTHLSLLQHLCQLGLLLLGQRLVLGHVQRGLQRVCSCSCACSSACSCVCACACACSCASVRGIGAVTKTAWPWRHAGNNTVLPAAPTLCVCVCLGVVCPSARLDAVAARRSRSAARLHAPWCRWRAAPARAAAVSCCRRQTPSAAWRRAGTGWRRTWGTWHDSSVSCVMRAPCHTL